MKAKFFRSTAAFLAFAAAISIGATVSKAQYGGGGGANVPMQQAPPEKKGDKGDKGYKGDKGEKVNKA